MTFTTKEFVLAELRKSNVRMTIGKKEVIICCPWHPDKNPSYHIVLENPKYSPGVGHCWSCGASGGWNKLAEKLNLKKITKETIAEVDPFFQLASQFSTSPSEVQVKLPKGTQPWKHGDWRGIPQDFLFELGARRWWDNKNDAYRILFPVYNNEELKGYIGARTDSVTTPKYRNSSGEWAKTTYFGYDYANYPTLKKIWKKYDYKSVALVEGSVDALRCWSYGIPALAILGTGNFSLEKKILLKALDVKKVVLFFDGDTAGREATKLIEKELKSYFLNWKTDFKIESYKLPIKTKKENQLDPGNCPEEYLDEVKKLLRQY